MNINGVEFEYVPNDNPLVCVVQDGQGNEIRDPDIIEQVRRAYVRQVMRREMESGDTTTSAGNFYRAIYGKAT